jgi:tRNA dimethylallyltransferase
MNNNMEKPKIIVICGPTGIGKTGTAICLAKQFRGEIIGADSMQIYRYMDIGTAKPSIAEQKAVPHHMIDIKNPDEPFDAGTYASMTMELISGMESRNAVPFVVGGTGLYIKALVYGLSRAAPADSDLLKRLKIDSEKNGTLTLYKKLLKKDPKTADKIHPNDTFRIIRALEVFEKTGKPISELHDDHGFSKARLNALFIGLNIEREKLYHRINKRVDEMITCGFLDEVKRLMENGYSPETKSMQSIGYRHLSGFLQKKLSWEDALNSLKQDTRRYAKRQLTWFKSESSIKWFNPGRQKEMAREIKKFLSL